MARKEKEDEGRGEMKREDRGEREEEKNER